MVQSALFGQVLPAASRSIYLWRTLVAQELSSRYRGTFLGAVWQFLAPLFLLGIYGFVFGIVFRARWPGLEEGGGLLFALNLFLGLLVHGVLAETLGQAPTVMQRNSNFVRKVVFPLPVLVAVPMGVALVNAATGLFLVALISTFGASPSPGTVLALWHLVPVLAVFAPMVLGLALFLAALGVYVRDLSQMIGMLVMAVLFTSPVFYPLEMAPESIRGVIMINPLTIPVEHLRQALLLGQSPDWSALGVYGLVACAVLAAGAATFNTLRRGFADML